jgi:hypothetical protein
MADINYSDAYLPVTLGNTDGKTVVMKTGTLTTLSITVDQVILTYTVTAGKTFYMEYLETNVGLNPMSSTGTDMGAISLESPGGTKLYTRRTVNANTDAIDADQATFSEPIPFASGTVVRVVCTPLATRGISWVANFGGFER